MADENILSLEFETLMLRAFNEDYFYTREYYSTAAKKRGQTAKITEAIFVELTLVYPKVLKTAALDYAIQEF